MSNMRVRPILKCLFTTHVIQVAGVIRSSDMMRNAVDLAGKFSKPTQDDKSGTVVMRNVDVDADRRQEELKSTQDGKTTETPMVQRRAAQPDVESSKYERVKTGLEKIVDLFKFGDVTLLQTGNHPNRKINLCNQGNAGDCSKLAKPVMLKKLAGLAATVLVGSTTPEVIETVSSMVSHLQTGALAKITEDHNDAQTKINTDLEDLKTTTEGAADTWRDAVSHDTAWLACVAEERALLQDVETCRATEEALLQDKLTTCNLTSRMTALLDSSSEPDLSFTCDFKSDNCAIDLVHLHQTFDHWFESLNNKVAQDRHRYISATQECDTAANDHQNKLSECNGKQVMFSSQKRLCERKIGTRNVAMCVFGDKFQATCKAKKAYDETIDQINGNGTVYSDSERRSEWKAVSTIVCMLNKFKANGSFTQKEMIACESSLDYDAVVGTLNKQDLLYQRLIAQEHFTCSMSNITFNGSLWTVPDGENTNSSQYTYAPHDFPVNASDGSQAFGFCSEGDRPNCSTFSSCPTTLARRDDATICQLASGCTIADCCVPQPLYGRGVADSNGCSSGQITDSAICEIAGNSLGGSGFEAGSFSHTPRGCYAAHAEKTYFNRHPIGDGHHQATPICQELTPAPTDAAADG